MPEETDNVFKGLYARFHDAFWDREELSEWPILQQFLEPLPKNEFILYPGSGSGRFLGPAHEGGHVVYGIEPSSEMVAASRRKFPKAPLREESWEDFSSNTESPVAAVIFPTFNLQLMDDPAAALKKAADLVKDEGQLYLTLFFPWFELNSDQPEGEWFEDRRISLNEREGGGTAVFRSRFWTEEARGIVRREHNFQWLDTNGRLLEEDFHHERIRFFDDQSLEKLLEKAGWQRKVREIYNLDPDDDGSDGVSLTTLFLEKKA